ncbi:MAG: metal-dependent hydrolase [Candidatus Anammoxibacter sp.]
MKVKFIGHSAIKLEGSKVVYIDPFLTGNPLATVSVDQIDKADYVIVTHDHDDHKGDAFEICKKTDATLISVHEIAVEAEKIGVKVEGMNIGGTLRLDNIIINMVNAQHSSASGHQSGVVIEMDNNVIYHSGDTGLFGDMKIIGEFFDIDLAFLPIGDRYTMGIPSAVKAVEYLRPKKVIPMHYNTFPIITADPEKFKKMVGNLADVIIVNPGESIDL